MSKAKTRYWSREKVLGAARGATATMTDVQMMIHNFNLVRAELEQTQAQAAAMREFLDEFRWGYEFDPATDTYRCILCDVPQDDWPAVTHRDACRLKRIEDGDAGRELLEEQERQKRYITRLEETVDLLLPYVRVPKGCNRPADLIQRTIERLKNLEAHILKTNGLLLLAAFGDGDSRFTMEDKEACRVASVAGQDLLRVVALDAGAEGV